MTYNRIQRWREPLSHCHHSAQSGRAFEPPSGSPPGWAAFLFVPEVNVSTKLDQTITIRLPAEQRRELERVAQSERRTVANAARILLEQGLAARQPASSIVTNEVAK